MDQKEGSGPMPENDNQQQLTAEELKALREIIEADKRAKWLWATIRNIAVWVAAVIGGISLAWDGLVTMLRHMVGK